jgi:hypothetical protein
MITRQKPLETVFKTAFAEVTLTLMLVSTSFINWFYYWPLSLWKQCHVKTEGHILDREKGNFEKALVGIFGAMVGKRIYQEKQIEGRCLLGLREAAGS